MERECYHYFYGRLVKNAFFLGDWREGMAGGGGGGGDSINFDIWNLSITRTNPILMLDDTIDNNDKPCISLHQADILVISLKFFPLEISR